MTREEAKQIVMFISGSYPNFKPLDLSETVDAWASVFSNFDVEQVRNLVKSYIMSDTKGFPPSISSIIQIYHKTTKPQELNEMEAWTLVRKAIGNGQNAAEEFGKLPPLVQKAVGIPDQLMAWGLDEHFNESVVMSHFISCYRAVAAMGKEFKKMPSEIRNRIESANSGSYAAQIEQKNQDILADADRRNKELDKTLGIKHKVAQPPDSYYELMERLRGEENEVD